MLLKEPRFGLQQNAGKSLVSKRAKTVFTLDNNDKKLFLPDEYVEETIKQLTWVAENDLDGWVRRDAEASLNKIKDWFIEWADAKLDLKVDLRN